MDELVTAHVQPDVGYASPAGLEEDQIPRLQLTARDGFATEGLRAR